MVPTADPIFYAREDLGSMDFSGMTRLSDFLWALVCWGVCGVPITVVAIGGAAVAAGRRSYDWE